MSSVRACHTHDFRLLVTLARLLAGFKLWEINPTSDLMALQRCLEDRELPQSIDELRILGHGAGGAD